MTRKVTAPAREGLRDPLSLAMLAAWVNVDPDKLPKEMQAPSCEHTMAAWKRVGEAAVAYIASRQPTPAPAADAEVRERSGVLEALETALHQYSDPMSPLNGHELGDRLASDVAEIVRHARARDAMLATSPKAPSVAIGAGEVGEAARIAADERTVAIGNIEAGYRPAHNAGAKEAAERIERKIRALAPPSASIPADVERYREALEEIIGNDDEEATISDLMQHDRNAGYLAGVRDCADIARSALAARPSTGGAMDGEGGHHG